MVLILTCDAISVVREAISLVIVMRSGDTGDVSHDSAGMIINLSITYSENNFKKELKAVVFVITNIKILFSFNVFSQHGPESMMAIAFTRRPSVSPSASTIVEVFETIIATGLKSYEHV